MSNIAQVNALRQKKMKCVTTGTFICFLNTTNSAHTLVLDRDRIVKSPTQQLVRGYYREPINGVQMATIGCSIFRCNEFASLKLRTLKVIIMLHVTYTVLSLCPFSGLILCELRMLFWSTRNKIYYSSRVFQHITGVRRYIYTIG